MPKFILLVSDEDNTKLLNRSFEELSSCKSFADNAIEGSQFRVRELQPFLWDEGDYLLGKRRFSGKVDWVRIPLHKQEEELC